MLAQRLRRQKNKGIDTRCCYVVSGAGRFFRKKKAMTIKVFFYLRFG